MFFTGIKYRWYELIHTEYQPVKGYIIWITCNNCPERETVISRVGWYACHTNAAQRMRRHCERYHRDYWYLQYKPVTDAARERMSGNHG